MQENGKPVLEFVAIKRKDNEQWAIPGVGNTQTVITTHLLFHVVLITNYQKHFCNGNICYTNCREWWIQVTLYQQL